MTIPRIAPPYDLDAPPAGVRLELGSVCTQYRVSVSHIAEAAQLPRTTAFGLLTNNWPARMAERERAAVRAAIEALLAARGASAEQLVSIWHAHGRRRPGVSTDVSTGKRGGARPAAQPEDEEPMLLAKQTLTPQARRHFKLFTNPFDGEVTTDAQMFSGDDIRYVREAAWQCSQTGSFVAIVGESGAGKTTIQADLEVRLEREARGVIVIKPSVLGMEENNNRGQMLKSTDILHAIITTLDPNATVPQTLQARTVRASKMLAASTEAGTTHLLVIEEAHGLPDATLKHLKRLHELRQGRRNLLGILLLAQPELKVRLANGLRTGALREVAQRCEMVELLPLDNDLRAYLQCRAQAAGHELGRLVDDAAIEALRMRLTRKTAGGAVSMCYPLAVHNMLTKALNTAAEIGVPVVTKDVVATC